MHRPSPIPPRRTVAALTAAAAVALASHASALVCDPQTGSPPANVLLGPNGEQFYPENTACKDRVVAPTCKNGTVLTFVDPADPNALRRYACVSSPDGATDLPLVVFLHGSRIPTVDLVFGGAGFRRARTDLQKLQESGDLGGPTPGYVLLMPQGRCMEAQGASSGDGVRFDIWHKDKDANLDVRAVRTFIQQLEDRTTFDEQGNAVPLPADLATIDPKRVYLMDWSNGGYLSRFMALSFPEEFAAVGSFASADPFGRFPCPTPLPSVSRKPGMMVVHPECDPILKCQKVLDWVERLDGAGWSDAENVNLITDASKKQVVAECRAASESRQGSRCPGRAHRTFANPQLPAMFDFLKGYELP